MVLADEVTHHLTRHDVVAGPLTVREQIDENVEMAVGEEVLALLVQDPLLRPVPRSLALDGDGSRGAGIRDDHVDPTGVAQRDGGDQATAGEFGGNEVFARDACEEGGGTQDWVCRSSREV